MRWAVVTACLLLGACQSPPNDNPNATSPPSSTTTQTTPRVWLSAAPDDARPVHAIVAETRAEHPGMPVVIYVGAEWCEPCKRFHQAAANKELDAVLGDVVFVEFDRDRDEQRLTDAGCITKLVPTFSIPTDLGKCSRRTIQGGIKGPGAVDNLTPRLRRLLGS